MKAEHVPSSPHKKGLSLSLSKKSGISGPIQNTPKPVRKQCQNWQLHRKSLPVGRPIQLFPNQTLVNIKHVTRPPVIIYRYEKSEWQKLQETNKLKRQQVDKMKIQLQALNRQLEQKKYKSTKQLYQVKSVPCSPSNTTSFNGIVEFLHIENSKPSSSLILSKEAARKENSFLGQAYKNNLNQPNSVQNFLGNPDRHSNQSLCDENLNPSGKNTNEIGQQKKFNFRSKRANIDVNSLLQIENRLNRLIDFTKF